jgi:glyceraldehyde 3-phosphate dehydrogenase
MAEMAGKNGRALGINGFGRIGKLTLWYQVGGKQFDHIVLNIGREVGKGLEDIAHYISTDSTYGTLSRFLHGFAGKPCIRIADREKNELSIDGTRVTILTRDRNPRDIDWAAHGVQIVVDTTGKFVDPAVPADDPKGSARGHLEGGARLVLTSAPFKIKDKNARVPDDSVMLIQGINHQAFDPSKHCVVSSASCTTTGLAHMVLPLLNHELTHKMLTASMSTIHAATNTQSVLDRAPAAGAKDLRKTRSILNNIILTSTGAARALEQVMPEISKIGFMADSVRIPTSTASLIILNCTFQSKVDDSGSPLISQELINSIYKEYSQLPGSGLRYSESQNVSTDMIGEMSAVVIEAVETHTRTGFITVNLKELGCFAGKELEMEEVEVPVTHLKVFGWYDNELGSYTKRMSELIDYMADQIF